MVAFNIHFMPDDRTVAVDGDTTLLDAARSADVYVGAVCGGEGTCGKCRLVVRSGQVNAPSTELLTAKETSRGYVLACQTRAKSDLAVEVPPESRLGGYRDVASASERFRDFSKTTFEPEVVERDPVVMKLALQIDEPTLDDTRGDHERVLRAVRDACGERCAPNLHMTLPTARTLPKTLRTLDVRKSSWKWQWDGAITATVAWRGPTGEVVFVERGETSSKSYGLAVDIGTTTVVAHLVDLTTGKTREAAAKYNSQVKLGADIITRINAARRDGGMKALNAAVVTDINALTVELAERAGITPNDILCVVAAGNTTMLHFLLGLEADLIRLSPFIPTATVCPKTDAAELGIEVNPASPVYALPHVGSYVGGDITAGILASRIYESDEVSLLLDIGTNGEVVLGNKEFLVACAASAGPAFEGGQISCGMRATAGAVDSVRISDSCDVELTTIDGAPPVGMCGTGLVDLLAEMLMAGLVDRTGNLQPDRAPKRFRKKDDDRVEFVVAEASSGGRDVAICQSDIENLIRTKGAIYAAADALVQSVGLSFGDIARVYIAGAFGNKLNVTNCITIGLLPDVDADRVTFVGNSSVTGAKMAMLSRKTMELAHAVADSVTYQELMVDPAYMEKLTSACFLPHTDVSRFPTVQEKLTTRG